ncbi:hypothetical protein ACS0TY_008641 [Phlomoides rotata]
MSMAANSASSVPVHPSQNSPRSRQSRKPSAAARGISSPSDISPPPMSGIIDQEQFFSSSSSMAPDFLPANAMVAEDGGGLSVEDVELENSDGGAAAKKPAWNMPSNVPTAEVGVGVVMGAESWPALSESARASPRSPLKAPLQAPVTLPQDLPVVSLPSPKEVSTPVSIPNPHPNQLVPSRQKPMKRGGVNSSIPVNDSLPQPPSVQQSAAVDPPPSNAGKTGGSGGEHSRDNPNKDGGQRGGTYGGHDSQTQRPYRRSNSGPLTRGDGSHHGNHRRDHGKQDWGNRSFGSRESHGQRVVSRPFMRGPAPNATFIPPPPPVAVRPFVNPVYQEMQSPVYYLPHPDSLRSIPMVPIPSMYYPMIDPHLPSKIVNQIDYYFSNENLVKDAFLRQNMDAEGWVSIKLIAGFKKMMMLTDNIQLIADAIKASNMVEVQGDKVRRKGDWNKWIMPQNTVTSPQSINWSNQNMLPAHLSSLALDEKAAT